MPTLSRSQSPKLELGISFNRSRQTSLLRPFCTCLDRGHCRGDTRAHFLIAQSLALKQSPNTYISIIFHSCFSVMVEKCGSGTFFFFFFFISNNSIVFFSPSTFAWNNNRGYVFWKLPELDPVGSGLAALWDLINPRRLTDRTPHNDRAAVEKQIDYRFSDSIINVPFWNMPRVIEHSVCLILLMWNSIDYILIRHTWCRCTARTAFPAS